MFDLLLSLLALICLIAVFMALTDLLFQICLVVFFDPVMFWEFNFFFILSKLLYLSGFILDLKSCIFLYSVNSISIFGFY